MEREIHFFNDYHLGDMGYHIHFCNKLLLKYPNVKIINYTHQKYIDELKTHVYPQNQGKILFDTLDKKPSHAINCWIDRNRDYKNWLTTTFEMGIFDEFYVNFYKQLFGELGFVSPVETLDDFLFDHPFIKGFSDNVEFYDFLIINSNPFSGQWFFNFDEFETLVSRIKRAGYSVITTRKSNIPGVPCTLDNGYNLMQIASQAMKVKYVVGVHTSPWLYAFNKHSVENVEFFVCLQNQGITYSPDNVFNIKNGMDNVYKLLKLKGLAI